MTLKKINILEYAFGEGGGGHQKAYAVYAFINVDNCERPLRKDLDASLKMRVRTEEPHWQIGFVAVRGVIIESSRYQHIGVSLPSRNALPCRSVCFDGMNAYRSYKLFKF